MQSAALLAHIAKCVIAGFSFLFVFILIHVFAYVFNVGVCTILVYLFVVVRFAFETYWISFVICFNFGAPACAGKQITSSGD